MTMMEPDRGAACGPIALLGGNCELLLTDTVERCNAEAGRALDCAPELLIGRAWADLMPERQPDGSPSRDGFERRLAAVHAGLSQCFVWQLRSPGGRDRS